MHQLKIIDGRLYLDDKKLCGVQGYSIDAQEAGGQHVGFTELNLKLMVNLRRVDEKESISEKAEWIEEQLAKGRMSLDEARAEYGQKPIDDGTVLTVLMPERADIKDKRPNTYQIISNFLKRERGEVEKALKSEKRQVCIKADSYIAKEIKYQTALLHELLDEVRNIKK
ncbi:hypothetical protein [Lacrimispora sp.]|uniref:hypothetical protein n=1 Tax=Lacrimispora sp. TaxID=2719234 RepID=UPI0032E46D4F